MAMSKRSGGEKQEDIWIAHTELAVAPGHPFYKRLNELLEGAGFDELVEGLCARFYHARLGRPSLRPGIYFRALLIGYFEGIDSERGIAWRVADSLALRRFLGIGLDEQTPDHSTISRTRRLIDIDRHREVFSWVLGLLAERGLLKGQRMGIDATTLEANAAMRSIVRRDTGETYDEFLCGLECWHNSLTSYIRIWVLAIKVWQLSKSRSTVYLCWAVLSLNSIRAAYLAFQPNLRLFHTAAITLTMLNHFSTRTSTLGGTSAHRS